MDKESIRLYVNKMIAIYYEHQQRRNNDIDTIYSIIMKQLPDYLTIDRHKQIK